MQGPRRTWPLGLLAVWGLATVLRWALWPEDPLGLVLSRDWGAPPSQVVPPLDILPGLWAQSPLAHASLWPAAALGPAPFHVAQASLAGLVAPAAALAVARAGRAWGFAAGLLVAVHPALLGAGAGPVALALPAVVLGVAASAEGRHARAALLLAVGGAMSVAVALACLPLAAFAAALARRRGEARWWPLQLDVRTSALLWAGLGGALPAAYAWLVLDVGAVQGVAWTDAILPLLPLAVVGVAALAVPAARDGAVAGLGGLALALPLAAAGIVDPVAAMTPAVLLLVAAVPVAAAAVARAKGMHGEVRPGARSPASVAVAVGAAAALALAASAGAALPLQDDGASTAAALRLVPDSLRDRVFVVDLPWQDVAWVAGEVGELGWALSAGVTDTGPWSVAVEDIADATLLRVGGTRLNEALREVYSDCILASGAGHVVIVGRDCKGRGDELRAAVAGA